MNATTLPPATEPVISVAKACSLFPAGHTVTPRTLRTWINVGVGGIKLESVKIGSLRFTTEAAVRRFIARCNGLPVSEPTGNGHKTQAEAVASV